MPDTAISECASSTPLAPAAPARNRRLPTKTSSGLIKCPPSAALLTGVTTSSSPQGEESTASPCTSSSSPPQCSLEGSSSVAPREHVLEASVRSKPPVASSVPEAESQVPCAQQSPAPAVVQTGLPKLKAKPLPPPVTGPLNASTSPQVQALPVKRRGSYQSLKRLTARTSPNLSALKGEDAPSVLSLLKKPTHWEKFGTIMVLCCKPEDSDADGILQMLSAEGYDSQDVAGQQEALNIFGSAEVYPDIVLIDLDHKGLNTLKMIKQLQCQNPTVAIVCVASVGAQPDAVTALQAGAADYIVKPLDLDELVARIERHVQRQHCIKLELEKALEDAKQVMAQLASATMIGDMVFAKQDAAASHGMLIAVAETDFEEQITELSEENQRLGAKVEEMERKLELKDIENRELNNKLVALDTKLLANTNGVKDQINLVAEQNQTLKVKVDELEKMIKTTSIS